MAVINNFLNSDIVFIHIPKNGGTTVKKIFKGNREVKQIIDFEYPKDLQNKFTFTFVRNPFDRFISAYSMYKNGFDDKYGSLKITNFKDRETLEKMSPKEMIIHAKKKLDNCEPNSKEFIDGAGFLFHIIPQTHKFNFLERSNYIGRFENFENDLREICNINNVSFRLPYYNKSIRDDYRSYYDDELIDLVSEFYYNDLKELRYEF